MDAREAIIEYASIYLEVVFLKKEIESDREHQTLQALDEMLTIEHAKLVLEQFNGDVASAYRFLTNRNSGCGSDCGTPKSAA